MKVGAVYTITLGRYSDRYLCAYEGAGTAIYQRVRLPTTKIDAIRRPETIHINLFATSTKSLEKSDR